MDPPISPLPTGSPFTSTPLTAPSTPLLSPSTTAKLSIATLDAKIRTAINQFLYPKERSPEEKQVLLWYMDTRPISANPEPILSSEEIEVRLKLIIDIRKIYDDSACKLQRSDEGRFQLTALQLVYLLLISVDHLRDIREAPMVLYLPYYKLGAYVCLMTRHIMPNDIFVNGGTLSPTPNNKFTLLATGTMNIGQNAIERAKCAARDGGACILTGAAFPDVCHIVPFEINASKASLAHYRNHLFHLTCLMGKEARPQVTGLLDSGVGCSDKAWNMLCLHPTLRDWWSKCFFGLKCTGICPTSSAGLDAKRKYTGSYLVKLQFHWMPRNNGVHPRDYAQPDHDTIEKMLKIKERDNDIITRVQKHSSCRLQSGQIFTLSMSREDATKMRQMIDIQWANVRLAAMSGLTTNVKVLYMHAAHANGNGYVKRGAVVGDMRRE
ncbi:uncharacterized protein Triagg1_9314 [Trichoderma aggressivum f. europaeum]|uniref:HNH nuclease domain-containing protein n=1 Tax=Trichoderma aggressivum f. europaeum TaxID=173218 RepID=A0AAE1LZ56_9HYPO|nr:hypothetical protein Triagg1_9314 [Trichoderma aggressivum f. europaeum]